MMKKVVFLAFLIMCGLGAAFGQLKVINNFGRDIKVRISGQEKTIPNKSSAEFNFRGRGVNFDVLEPVRFSLYREVPRSGKISIEPGDYQVPQIVKPAIVENQEPIISATPVQSNGSALSDILKSRSNIGQTTQRTASQITTPIRISSQQQIIQTQPALSKIWVIYRGNERIKIFSDLGGGRWQGLEFKGTDIDSTDKDNTKNEYLLNVQKDQDIHLGIVYPPKGQTAIFRYGEFRKRVNVEDDSLFINNGDIKKMSTEEEKMIRVKLNAKGWKIDFKPDGKLVSIGDRSASKAFKAPIGQWYLEISATDPGRMFHPTVFIPVHVTNRDGDVIITSQDLGKAVNTDLNLNWSGLRYK